MRYSFVFFLILCHASFSQTGYIRQILDSNNVKVFGNIGFVDQDDSFLYVGANTTYDEGGFCNGSNGQSFILKIDKLTGTLANSFNVNADTMVMQINDGFYHNNAIYFAGQSSRTPWSPTYSFISKYNLQTNQIEWTKSFQNESNWRYGINNVKFNTIDGRIYFCGNEISNTTMGGGFLGTAGYTVGHLDTLGSDFHGSTMNMSIFNNNTAGTYTNNILFLNSSIELLNSTEKIIISLNEISGQYGVTLPIQFYEQNNANWSMFTWAYGGYSNSPITEAVNLQFCKFLNNRLIRVLNGSNGFNCYLTDTNSYFSYKSKRVDNIDLKYATSNNNRLFITCADTSSNCLINLEMDTTLNVINSKKIIIDSLQTSSSVKTIFDSNTNYLYNIFTKKGHLDESLFIHKTNFSTNNCNEFPVSVNTSSFSSVSLTYTIGTNDTIHKSNINLIKTPKSFTNTDACSIITKIDEQQLLNNDLILKTLINNEFMIVSVSNLINEVIVYDMLGKKILSKELKDYNSIVNLQNYVNGLYFINIKYDNGKENTFKVIKEDY